MLLLNDLHFRKIETDDLEMILYWRNSTDVRKYMLNDKIIKLEDHIKWFKKISKNKSFDVLVTEYKKKPVGIVSISELDLSSRTCTWGQYIGADISSPPFDKVAKLYGAKGYKVDRVSEINEAVKAAISCKKPAVIDVAVDPKALYSFRRDSFKHRVK